MNKKGFLTIFLLSFFLLLSGCDSELATSVENGTANQSEQLDNGTQNNDQIEISSDKESNETDIPPDLSVGSVS